MERKGRLRRGDGRRLKGIRGCRVGAVLYGTLCRGKGKEEEGSQTLPSQMCVTCNIQSVEDGRRK